MIFKTTSFWTNHISLNIFLLHKYYSRFLFPFVTLLLCFSLLSLEATVPHLLHLLFIFAATEMVSFSPEILRVYLVVFGLASSFFTFSFKARLRAKTPTGISTKIQTPKGPIFLITFVFDSIMTDFYFLLFKRLRASGCVSKEVFLLLKVFLPWCWKKTFKLLWFCFVLN